MSIRQSWRGYSATLALLAIALLGSGCFGRPKPAPAPPPPPPPIPAQLSVLARADVNPDESGRPSPIVIRIYQLKDDAAFRNADFFSLWDKEQATLAASLIDRQEFVLSPGDAHTAEFPVSGEAQFVAVAASFRDIRNADWRALADAPKKSYKTRHTVSVIAERTRASLAVSK